MVPIVSLWLPISAVIVFVLSSLIHMLLGYHRNDFDKLPDESGVLNALRPFGLPPGDYMAPCAKTSKEMKDPAFKEKLAKGPVAVMTVLPSGSFSMGRSLLFWLIYCVVISIIAAYIAGRALHPGSPYLQAFRFAGATAFVGYSLALWQDTIWYRRKWTTTLRFTIDGLIYGLMTGGTFGALWPK